MEQVYYDTEIMNGNGLPSDAGKPKSNFVNKFSNNINNQQFVEQQPQFMDGAEYVGSAMRANEEEVQFKLDGARILDSLQHSLLGEVWDITEGRWKKVSDPLLSPKGVGKVLQILSFSMANVDHRLTKLGIDAINFSLIETRNNLRRQLMLDPVFRVNYDTPLPIHDIKVVLEEVCECKESLLKRSLDGFTVHQTGHSEQHTYHHQDDYKQGGGLKVPSLFQK